MIDSRTNRCYVLDTLHELGGVGTRDEVLRIMQDSLQGRMSLYDWREIGMPPRASRHHKNPNMVKSLRYILVHKLAAMFPDLGID